MAVIDADKIQKDEELDLRKNSLIKSMASKKKLLFYCEFCDKILL